MKIIELVANKAWGGGEQYVYDLVERLSKEKDIAVTVVCPKYEALKRFTLLDASIVNMSLKGYHDFVSICSLVRLLKNECGGIVVHAHDFKRAFLALLAKKLSGVENVKVIMTRHLVRKAKNGPFERFVYKNIDHIIFVSKLSFDTFFSANPVIDKAKCSVLYNGVKDNTSVPAFNIRNKYSIGEDSMILMYHGRIVEEKGIDTIIDALAMITIDFCMVFVGTGEDAYLDTLKQKICDLGLEEKVIWAGYQNDVHSYVSQSDCGITPSVVPESFGLSNIEYMRAGKVLITTDNGAQKEYVDNGKTGFLVSPGDSKTIAKIVHSLLDKDYAQHIGENAKKYYYDNLSFDKFYSCFRSIIFPNKTT